MTLLETDSEGLIRFVQEGLNNAWRHAEGRGQEVRLTVAGDTLALSVLALSVLDRGPGFVRLPVDPAADETGLGLGGLADRVEALGGWLRCDSHPGAGTTLVAELPCGS